jgi:hypothetical protein
VAKYFAMSFNNIHMVNKYNNNIPWHGMEYALRFLHVHLDRLDYSCSHVHSLTSIIATTVKPNTKLHIKLVKRQMQAQSFWLQKNSKHKGNRNWVCKKKRHFGGVKGKKRYLLYRALQNTYTWKLKK